MRQDVTNAHGNTGRETIRHYHSRKHKTWNKIIATHQQTQDARLHHINPPRNTRRGARRYRLTWKHKISWSKISTSMVRKTLGKSHNLHGDRSYSSYWDWTLGRNGPLPSWHPGLSICLPARYTGKSALLHALTHTCLPKAYISLALLSWFPLCSLFFVLMNLMEPVIL